MSGRTERHATILTGALLAAAAGISLLLPHQLVTPRLWAAPPAGEIRLGGVIRDVRESHADFEVMPAGGPGHYAGLVEPTLGAARRPVFAGEREGTVAPNDIDLVAYWRFDEGSSSTTADNLGINNGTLMNGTTWVAGQHGTALHFDGIDDYVAVPEHATLRINGNVTIAGWFKLDDDFDGTSTSQIIMERTFDDNHMFAIVLAGQDYDPQASSVTPGSFVFKLESGTPARYKWTNRTSWTGGEWYHFACVMYGAESASNRILIDGVDATSPVDWGSSDIANMDWSGPYNVGGKSTDQNNLPGERYFKGTLDEVMIVNRALTAPELPSSSAGGYKVSTQWRNGVSQPIAPHLYVAPVAAASGIVDRRVGSDADDAEETASSGSVDLTSSDLELAVDGSSSALVGMRFENMNIPAGATIDQAWLQFKADETDSDAVTLNIRGQAVHDAASFTNAAFDISARARTGASVAWSPPSWNSTGVMGFDQRTPDLSAVIQEIVDRVGWSSGNAMALIVDGSGTRTAESYDGDASGAPLLHVEFTQPPSRDGCGNIIADALGSAGVDGDGGISSAETFGQWFSDAPGENLSGVHAITLVNNGAGVYELLLSDFHPIDGLLFGNEGHAHNRHFTYALTADLTYEACTGQFIEFDGDDSFWLFINGQLVLDLGGLRPQTGQVVELDRLDLVDGSVCQVRLFYAQRRSADARFNLRTNVQMSTDRYVPPMTAAYD